jgi:TP901 family phage tail tape measure protein
VASSTQLIFDIFAKDHNTSDVFKGIEGSAGSLGKALASALGPLGLGIGAGLGIAEIAKGLGEAVKAAGDFQAANTRLVTSAGESAANLKEVGDGILQVAQDTGTATDELEKGAYYIESAGFHGADMLNVLKAAAQGAKAEGSDVATVGDAVTSALRDYHLSASDAADVTSKLITATSQGKTTFELFSGSLHSVLPLASAAHISLDDILGDLASMTVHGMSADQATQNLNDTIRHMLNPTQQQTKEFALFGLTAQGVSDSLSSKGLSGTLDMLHDKIVTSMPPGSDKLLLDMKTALSELDPQVQELGQHLFDGSMGWKEWMKQAVQLDPVHEKQITQLATLLGSTHALGNEQMSGETVLQNYAQAWRLLTGDATGANTALMLTGENADYTHQAINAVAGATKDASGNVKGWAEIQDNFNTKLDQTKEVFETMSIKIGEKLLPALSQALDGFLKFVHDVSPTLKTLYNKDIAPAMEDISKIFNRIFGDSSGTTGVTGNAADGFGNSMKKVGDDAGHTLGSGGTVSKAAQDFNQSMGTIMDIIKTALDAYVAFDEGSRQFRSSLGDAWASFDTWSRNLRSSLGDDWAAFDTWSRNTRASLGNWQNAWSIGIESVVGDVENLHWRVLGALADAGSWLVNAGADLVSGFITGIAGMVPNLVSEAETMATGAVQSVKDALGIHSPSVVFHDIGINVGQGFINGIDSMHGATGDAMGRLASVATSSFDMSPTLAMGGASAAFGSPAIYVQNPFTGEYLLAKMSGVAGQAIDAADFRGARRPSL